MTTKENPWPEGWEFEPADPSVGLFRDRFIHEDCPKVVDRGTTHETAATAVEGNPYAEHTVTVTCHDCGATMSFTTQVLNEAPEMGE
jgi:hypothetical protein